MGIAIIHIPHPRSSSSKKNPKAPSLNRIIKNPKKDIKSSQTHQSES